MRLIFILTSILFSWSSLAADLPQLSGEYRFRGSPLIPMFEINHQTAYDINDEERRRIRELENIGYICQRKMGQHVLCRRLQDIESLPLEIEQEMEQEIKGDILRVLSSVTGRELISQGSSFEEWRVDQSLEYNGKVYRSYRVQFLDQEIVKVVLGAADSSDFHSFVYEAGALQRWVAVRRHGERSWTDYSALAPLTP